MHLRRIPLTLQGGIPGSRESNLGDHVAAVKPNGSHVSYPDTTAAAHINGKTTSEGFEHIIHSMAQVYTLTF